MLAASGDGADLVDEQGRRSHAAKWPPRPGSFQYTMLVKRRRAWRREGRGISLGKMLHPAGTVMVSLVAVVNHSVTWAMLCQ